MTKTPVMRLSWKRQTLTRPAPRPDLDQLAQAILAAQRAGLAIPCRHPDHWPAWTSEDRDERAQAAHACPDCPAFTQCAEAGRNESGGIWAGQDHTRT